MTAKEFFDRAKDCLSLLQAALPFVEKSFPFLPVNPAVREELWIVSTLVAVVAGFGTYRSTKISTNTRSWLWLWGIILFVVFLLLQIGLGHGLNLGPVQPWATRALYVLLFLTLGMAIGGVLGLLP
jgi:hypothetical protein